MKNEKNILAEIGNQNPFTVPQNYFENFAVAMEQQIFTEKKEAKTIPLYSKLKPFYYIAAAVVMAFFAGDYLIMKTSNDINVADSAETYSMPEHSDVLLAYIDEHTLVEYYLTSGEEL